MSDAAELVTVTFGGKTFECTRRTIAHLSWTDKQLRAKGKALRVIQGSYNRGVAASAGTHDYDAVFDVGVMGLEWPAAQKVLRELGWAAWWRQPPTFSHHIHMISLGYPGQVGVFVPGQVADYYAHRSGLSGHVADSSWHPADIDSTIFDYPAWVAEQEDKVDDATIEKIANAAAKALLATRVDLGEKGAKDDRSVEQVLKELWNKRNV